MKTLSFHAFTLLLTLSLSSLFLVACGDEEEVVTADTDVADDTDVVEVDSDSEDSTPEGSGPGVPPDEGSAGEGSTTDPGEGSGVEPEEGSAPGAEGSGT
jgi:hypothetical protein